MKRLAAAVVISILLHGWLLGVALNRDLFRDKESSRQTRQMSFSLLDPPPVPSRTPPPPFPPQPTAAKNRPSVPQRTERDETPIDLTDRAAPKPEAPAPPEAAPHPPPTAPHQRFVPDMNMDMAAEPIESRTVPVSPSKNGTPEKNAKTPPDRKAAPDYRNNPKPDYPDRARKRGYEGTVELAVRVGRDGQVLEADIHRSSGYGILDRAALEAVKTWRFEPGIRESRPVDMQVIVPVTFDLE